MSAHFFVPTNVHGMDVYQWNHGIKGICYLTITWSGGVLHAPSKHSLMAWKNMMFKASQTKDKEAIWQALDQYGADVSIEVDQSRVLLHVSCVAERMLSVWPIVFECLSEAVFTEQEWSITQQRLVAQKKASRDQLEVIASEVLCQQLYPKGHIGHIEEYNDSILALESLSIAELDDVHQLMVNRHDMRVFIAGVLPSDWVQSTLVMDLMSLSEKKVASSRYAVHVPDAKPMKVQQELSSKQTATVVWGKVLDISPKHPDYPAVLLANYMLGGNFTAHLMQTVRDQQGLTYGIYSSLSGFSYGLPGMWCVRASFSPEQYEQGLLATEAEIASWQHAITSETVEQSIQSWLGAKRVSMASISMVLRTLRWSVDQGFGLDYHGQLNHAMSLVTYDQVLKVIDRYLKGDDLTRISVGCF